MDNIILDKSEFDKVSGEIYKITNTVTNKHYIGQTRSHRLNRGKYRPFGYMGRFKDHISESQSNKKHTCKYLNSSIIKYGKDNFDCELLIRCSIDELDAYEQQFIKDYDSKYPNGYNLTDGGQKGGCRKGTKVSVDNADIVARTIVEHSDPNWFRKRPRSDETKQRISDAIKQSINKEGHLTKMMKLVQNQHLEKKYEILKDVEIDPTNLDQYIEIVTNKNNTTFVRITCNKKQVSFVGKHESIEDTKERALKFMRELINRGNTTKLRETTLEPSLPLHSGNSLEELG